MGDYNHTSFPLDMESSIFASFRDGLKAGDRAPRATLTDLASGAPVKLHHLWRERPLVMEFGSIT